MISYPATALFSKKTCPRNVLELEQIIRDGQHMDPGRTFERLRTAIEQTDGFVEKILPFLWDEVRQTAEILPEFPLLDTAGSLTLTERQCLCILANAFFCTFPGSPSRHSLRGAGLPSINFDELYGGHGWGTVEVAKLRMVFNYFDRSLSRRLEPARPPRSIRLTRSRATQTKAHWIDATEPLLPPVMHPLQSSIDDAKSMLRVDFANRIIGGAALATGCVQEEIMFCLCPELITSRLFCPVMKDDEAILIAGAEQFSRSKGYASKLQYDGPLDDTTPLEASGIMSSHVVAIDALDLREIGVESQYRPEGILRELTKCWAAFSIDSTPADVATGNWGCGVFGGDPELKSVIQWLALSRARKVMHYFPWDNAHLHSTFPPLARQLVERGLTVGAVVRHLLETAAAGNIFAALSRLVAR